VCTQCSRPYAPSAQEQAFLQTFSGDAPAKKLAKGAGCQHCNGTGFLGRLGAYELLEMTPRVVAAFNGGETQTYLDAARREIGELSLAHHVCDLVQAGRTTVQEAMRLIGRASEPHPSEPATPP
jgi:MSHA biogenesis protein MshE